MKADTQALGPWEMTKDNFEASIMRQKERVIHTESKMDWGGNRGQGKRSGGIKGAMSNAPRGIKIYRGVLPDYPEWKGSILESGANPILYSKAREFGLGHKDAGHVAIVGPEEFHRKIIKAAISKGEPVPLEVLTEYQAINGHKLT